jgi:hypothetical protein
VEPVELRRPPGRRNHAAKENNIRPTTPNLIQHLVIVQA